MVEYFDRTECWWWSDSKKVYPSLQKPSFVQHCPSCGKYFFREEKTLYKTGVYSLCDVAWGNLSYHSLREAFYQLSPTGKNEREIRLMLLHAHNDLYGGCEGTKPRTDASAEELQFFEENAMALISKWDNSYPGDLLLIAELYRELGQFDEAIRVLREPFDNTMYMWLGLGLDSARCQILQRAEQYDANVFIISKDKNHRRNAVLTNDRNYPYDDNFEKNYINKDYLPF